jgi:Fe-S cluster assembly ATPase SufC
MTCGHFTKNRARAKNGISVVYQQPEWSNEISIAIYLLKCRKSKNNEKYFSVDYLDQLPIGNIRPT